MHVDRVIVCDCDGVCIVCRRFTKDWVRDNRGVDMTDLVVDVAPPPVEAMKVPPPPSIGYGTEEDSLGSVFHLVLKVALPARACEYNGVL